MTIRDRLLWCLRAADCSQREAGRLAGRAESHLGLILAAGGENTTAAVLADYARVFGVDLGWLVGGSGVRPTERQVIAAVERARVKWEQERAAASPSPDPEAA